MLSKSCLILVALTILAGCEKTTKTSEKIHNIRRIFMQNEGKYIVYTQPPGSSEIRSITINTHRGGDSSQKIKVVADVAVNEPAWAEVTKVTASEMGGPEVVWYQNVTIHIHDLKQIEGAEEETSDKHPVRNRNSPVE